MHFLHRLAAWPGFRPEPVLPTGWGGIGGGRNTQLEPVARSSERPEAPRSNPGIETSSPILEEMRKGLMPSRITRRCISGLPRYTSVRFLAFLPQAAQHVAFTHQIELFCMRGSKEIMSSTEKHSSIASLVIEHAVAEHRLTSSETEQRGARISAAISFGGIGWPFTCRNSSVSNARSSPGARRGPELLGIVSLTSWNTKKLRSGRRPLAGATEPAPSHQVNGRPD